MKKGCLLFALAGLALLGGCGRTAQVEDRRNLLCADTTQQTLFDASVEVLHDMQFKLETADLSAGLIRTWPLRGGQFFEPWRSDNASAEMAALANLHSIRRIVELEFIAVPQLGKVCVDSRVFVQRLSVPGEFYGGTRLMAALFTEGDDTEQSLLLQEAAVQEAAWEDLGRDPALEREILTRIDNEAR